MNDDDDDDEIKNETYNIHVIKHEKKENESVCVCV